MKLMFTPTSGVPSDVITCPRITHACLREEEKEQHEVPFMVSRETSKVIAERLVI